MREVGFGVRVDVVFNLVPLVVFIAYLFTPGANGQQSAESFDFEQGSFQLGDQLFTFFGGLVFDQRNFNGGAQFGIVIGLDDIAERLGPDGPIQYLLI